MTSPTILSIIIPCVDDPAASPILKSWRAAETGSFHVQFVYLINSKEQPSQLACSHKKLERHEILRIPSDRYFGSCEENIARITDFIGLLGDYILIVGEHDAINWQELGQCLDFIISNRLDALAVNIESCQKQLDGSFRSLNALIAPKGNQRPSLFIRSLLKGGIVNGGLGFSTLISRYGPIDWAAFIGSHIYSRETIRRILMQKTPEAVYSLVYKQLLFFCNSDCRYGLFEGTPITRISDEFLRIKQGHHSFGWLEEHRTVRGLTPCFWIANLDYLNWIEDDKLAALVVYSRCLGIGYAEQPVLVYRRSSLLRLILYWCLDVIRHVHEGNSHYFDGKAVNDDLGDLHTVYMFLKNLTKIVEGNRIIYALHRPRFHASIAQAKAELHTVTYRISSNSNSITKAGEHIMTALGSLRSNELDILSDYTLRDYNRTHSCTGRRRIERSAMGPRRYIWSTLAIPGRFARYLAFKACQTGPVRRALSRDVAGSD